MQHWRCKTFSRCSPEKPGWSCSGVQAAHFIMLDPKIATSTDLPGKIYVYMYTYLYIHICIYISCVYIYIYMHVLLLQLLLLSLRYYYLLRTQYRMYANISDIFTNVVKYFGHHPCLDESSGQKSPAILNVFAFHAY